MKIEDIIPGQKYKNSQYPNMVFLGVGMRKLFTGIRNVLGEEIGNPIKFEDLDLIIIESGKPWEIGWKVQKGDDADDDYWECFYPI